MKPTNARGYDGVSTNMIKYCESHILIVMIRKLINAIFRNGYFPKYFNRSIIVPIIKNQKIKKFDTSNYRPLSVSNVLAQIFERIILMKNSKLNDSNINQFGFIRGISCIQPISIVNKIISQSKV